jgi:phage terminase large subunit GpA-like protein
MCVPHLSVPDAAAVEFITESAMTFEEWWSKRPGEGFFTYTQVLFAEKIAREAFEASQDEILRQEERANKAEALNAPLLERIEQLRAARAQAEGELKTLVTLTNAHRRVHPKCQHCGWEQQFPVTQYEAARDAINEHAAVCEKHPQRAVERELKALKQELEAILDRVPEAVRVREGGGQENLAASLAMTVFKLRDELRNLKGVRPH